MQYTIKTMELKVRRIRKGYTQEQLSQKSGVPQATIARIEGGMRIPRPGTLKKLSDALDAQADEFIILEGCENNEI